MPTNGIDLSRSQNNNLTRIELGDSVTLWFSYETIIAFAVEGEGIVKSENIWSATTGRHLAQIPGNKVSREEFTKRLERLLTAISFVTAKHKSMLVTELAHERIEDVLEDEADVARYAHSAAARA